MGEIEGREVKTGGIGNEGLVEDCLEKKIQVLSVLCDHDCLSLLGVRSEANSQAIRIRSCFKSKKKKDLIVAEVFTESF